MHGPSCDRYAHHSGSIPLVVLIEHRSVFLPAMGQVSDAKDLTDRRFLVCRTAEPHVLTRCSDTRRTRCETHSQQSKVLRNIALSLRAVFRTSPPFVVFQTARLISEWSCSIVFLSLSATSFSSFEAVKSRTVGRRCLHGGLLKLRPNIFNSSLR